MTISQKEKRKLFLKVKALNCAAVIIIEIQNINKAYAQTIFEDENSD